VVSPPDTVHFLSDYGLRDEFVGVVHATLHRIAPHVHVVDLTHGLRAFDVRGAGLLLARVLPHLGPGVILGVVDPGVGGSRRGLCIEVHDQSGPRWLVGPDNGLLMAAADATGPIAQAIELNGVPESARRGTAPADAVGRWSGPVTFDGRDLFAPAAAALCRGTLPDQLGAAADPDTLIRLPPPVAERGVSSDGRPCLRAEVTWVDRFGNVKTSVAVDDELVASLPLGSVVSLASAGSPGSDPVQLRTVRAFAELGQDELGAMADADGHLAIVAAQRSAALLLDLGIGDLVELWW
jgi:S-adenosyl-L-methionine hydrolase (adenosine-forming)